MNRKLSKPLSPELLPFEADLSSFCQMLRDAKLHQNGSTTTSPVNRQDLVKTEKGPIDNGKLSLLFTKNVLIDLALTGWEIDIEEGTITFSQKKIKHKTLDEAKSATRREHLNERNSQLLEKSVSSFIDSMERRRLTKYGWRSIFSLMRDGQELANLLKDAKKLDDSEKRYKQLEETVKPYLQFAESGTRCKHTDLLLSDIWRYFRHTWVSPYTSLPGRNISILIRDAAAPNHPVIGIAALGSSIVQQALRDQWIGWDSESMIRDIENQPSSLNAKWLNKLLNGQIDALYKIDLCKERLISTRDIKHPTQEIIDALRIESREARKRHQEFPHATKAKIVSNNKDWESAAQTDLYKSKRCGTLADLLDARLKFREYQLDEGKGKYLRASLKENKIRQIIGSLIRRTKAEHVGVDMMDIIICGAVPPYTHILGGKLACVLLTSPEIIKYYKKRYSEQESIIASSMAGRPVVRRPNLVFLGTTSLYGVGSSQYNRISIPANIIGGLSKEIIKYQRIGLSKGFGSFQFSRATRDVMETLLRRSKNGRRVNSIFGEGTNPFLRKIRDALNLVGLPAEDVLKHERTRIVYGVALAKNFRNVLISRNKKVRYFMPQSAGKKGTQRLSKYWTRRWLDGRITRDNILDDVASHSLNYPITHGARVPLYQLRQALSLNGEFDFEDG